MPKLLLFDIDGTLIESGGAGSRALTLAFKDVFAIRYAFSGINMAGKTDIQIIKEALSIHGLPFKDGTIPLVIERYIKHLSCEINNNEIHVKPGVIDVLDVLEKAEGYWAGLLTGNIQDGARIKLNALGLGNYFTCGAFGSDHEDRNKLLPLALKNFTDRTCMDVSYSDCTVIGDTPRDVECSKPYGAKSVAVSTGPFSYETLMETGADHVVTSMKGVLNFFFQ